MKPTSFMIDQRRGQAKARGWSGATVAGVDSILGSGISASPGDRQLLLFDSDTDTWDPATVLGLVGSDISPAQLTANTNDWNPTGLSTAATIRVSTDASRNLTGIVAPDSPFALLLQNVGAQDLVLKHDATSTAANRFYCPNDADLTLKKDSAVLLAYDLTSARWRVISPPTSGVTGFATPSITYGTAAAGSATTVIRSDATIAKPTAADVDFSSDVTTNNVTTSAHGLAPKGDGNAAHYLDGTGAYSTPSSAAPSSGELDYVQITSPVSITASTEGAATTVVTGSAVSYNGTDKIMVEFFSPRVRPKAVSGTVLQIVLYDGSNSIGLIGTVQVNAAANGFTPVHCHRRLTPSNASHTYSIRAYDTGSSGEVAAGAGGSGNLMPAYIRIVKV